MNETYIIRYNPTKMKNNWYYLEKEYKTIKEAERTVNDNLIWLILAEIVQLKVINKFNEKEEI